MSRRTGGMVWALILLTVAAATGCGRANLTELQKVKSGMLDVVLLSPRDGLRHGSDSFVIEFRSASGGLADVGMVHASASMPMSGTPMMGTIDVARTEVAGRYAATSEFSMAGTWRMTIQWDGPARAGIRHVPGQRSIASASSKTRIFGDLNLPRRGRIDDLTERGAGDVAVDGARSVELRVIEHVEHLEPDLQRLRRPSDNSSAATGQCSRFPARRRSAAAHCRAVRAGSAEQRRVERRALGRIVIDLEIRRREVRRVEQVVVDAVAERAEQRCIRVVVKRHRETRS